jgi:hypothetical protein
LKNHRRRLRHPSARRRSRGRDVLPFKPQLHTPNPTVALSSPIISLPTQTPLLPPQPSSLSPDSIPDHRRDKLAANRFSLAYTHPGDASVSWCRRPATASTYRAWCRTPVPIHTNLPSSNPASYRASTGTPTAPTAPTAAKRLTSCGSRLAARGLKLASPRLPLPRHLRILPNSVSQQPSPSSPPPSLVRRLVACPHLYVSLLVSVPYQTMVPRI